MCYNPFYETFVTLASSPSYQAQKVGERELRKRSGRHKILFKYMQISEREKDE